MGHYIVFDRVRSEDPKDDRERVLGEASTPAKAVQLAKRAKQEPRIIFQDGDVTRDFTKRSYNHADLKAAQEDARRADREPPSKLDPWYGVHNHAAKQPKKRTPGKRKRIG